jgi:hypothetical protein
MACTTRARGWRAQSSFQALDQALRELLSLGRTGRPWASPNCEGEVGIWFRSQAQLHLCCPYDLELQKAPVEGGGSPTAHTSS